MQLRGAAFGYYADVDDVDDDATNADATIVSMKADQLQLRVVHDEVSRLEGNRVE